MLAPTITIVSLVIVLPLLAIFWISFKPVGLADLRPVEASVRESLRSVDDQFVLEYRVNNRSQDKEITDARFTDIIPDVLSVREVPEPCVLNGSELVCDFGTMPPRFRERVRVPVEISGDADAAEELAEAGEPVVEGSADNILTNSTFTFENFRRIFDSDEFLSVLWATTFYTVFGTIGALVVGLFAALLLNKSFRGKGVLRGLYLFPYVSPIIAVAFTWVTLLDPFSGSLNALLVQMEVTAEPINFFGQSPQAL
ncbi:MAG: sugar ABC transporter permease, partial [Pseudomonadota bacterium]